MSLAKSLPVEDRLLRYQTILINGKNETATTTSKLQKELIDIRKDYRELLESAEARRIVRTATDSGHSNLMWDHVVCAFVSHANRWLITDFSESRGASAESERKASLESLDFVLALAHEDGPVLNNGANKLLKLIYEGMKRDDRRLRYGIAFLRLFGRHYTSYPVYVARLSGYANKGTVHFLNKSSELSALGFYTSEFMSLLLDCALNCDHPRWAEETAIKMGGAGIGSNIGTNLNYNQQLFNNTMSSVPQGNLGGSLYDRYEDGGEYDLTDEEIEEILAAGGSVEYI